MLPIPFSQVRLFVLLTISGTCFAQASIPPDRRIVFNDDAQVLAEAPETNTSSFVKAWLDRESQFVPFNTFVFLAATPDICTYDTKAGEAFGARFGDAFAEGWAPAMRGLRAEGTNALELVTSHMHSKGIAVLAAVRMNDTHHRSLDPDNPGCPRFAMEHPEFVIRQPDGRTNETALDYTYPQVREHRLAIMREVVEEHDVDGLELNFVRWAKHFPRDEGRAKAPLMTDLIGQVRRVLDDTARRRGVKRLTLGVRVPESIHACWLAGVDIQAWVEQGWVDYVVLATWNNTDPQLPVEEFTRFTKPHGVDTIVLMGNMIGALWGGPPTILDRGAGMSAKHANGYQGMLITEPEARAAAANYYAWGADSVSFWNVGIQFGRQKTATPEQRERIRRWTHAVQTPEQVDDGPRHYHYLPMGKGINSRKPPARNYPWYDEGRSPLGQPNGPILQFTAERVGTRLPFPFRMADGRDGEPLNGTLRFWVYHASDGDSIGVDINGRPIDPTAIRRVQAGARRGGLPGLRFEIPLADCPPLRGDNELGLTLETPADHERVPYMEELEVLVDAPTRTRSDNRDDERPPTPHTQEEPARAAFSVKEVVVGMKKASAFMLNTVSYRGGFVSLYTEDLSERWGEVPARDTMVWVQDPGTVGVARVLLNAYLATGDVGFQRYCEQVANALALGQHPSGGWHYFIDFDPGGIQPWYDNVGSQCWGWEEFYHYYGNCTFDDNVTTGAADLLLDLTMATRDAKHRTPLLKAIQFILDSQYPSGGWPQRYPLHDVRAPGSQADYTSFYTFNDGVIANNIRFLLKAHRRLGDVRYEKAAVRGMHFVLSSQFNTPQAGWAQQYDMGMHPGRARGFEPAALAPSTTVSNIRHLMTFYKITGDASYLRGIPDALEWLNRSTLPPGHSAEGHTHAQFVEAGTNRPLYAHREGTGVANGRYWVDYEPGNFPGHYGMQLRIDIDALREEYRRVAALTPAAALAEYRAALEAEAVTPKVPDDDVRQILESMDNRGAWVEDLSVPDYSDWKFKPRRHFRGISTQTYMTNMRRLLEYLRALQEDRR